MGPKSVRLTCPACALLLCCSGKCFEVQCVKKDFKDGYGTYLSRSSACKDENKRVVVKITDSVSVLAQDGCSRAWHSRQWLHQQGRLQISGCRIG